MDAIEILGSLLGGRSQGGQPQSSGSSSGGMGSLFEELLKAGTSRAEPVPPGRPSSRGGSVSHRPIDVESEASRLEDLLGVATGKRKSSATKQSSPQPQFPTNQSTTTAQPKMDTGSKPFPSPPSRQVSQQDEALALIRAMINASKADNKVDEKEQEAILSRVPNNQETIRFLRQELAKPLDVREFAWNVPLGLEVQVYTISLATISLDTQAEADYLKDLAHALRLDPELVNQIHTRYNVPTIY